MATSKGDMLTVPSSCHSAGQSQRVGTAADACTMSSQDCRHSSRCLRHAFPGLLCFTHIQSFTVSFPLLCDWLDLFLFHLWGKKLLICLLHIYNNIESYELSRVLLGAVIRIWYSVAIYFKFNSIGLRECQMYSNVWENACACLIAVEVRGQLQEQSAFTIWVQRPNSSVRSGDKCLSLLSHLTDSV